MDFQQLPSDLRGLMEKHGHLCIGVLLGYKACKYAADIIGISEKMEVTTVNGGCANDAVRYILGCTPENGKLTINEGGNQSWAFYNEEEEEGVLLSVNPNLLSQLPADKDQATKAILEMSGNLLFIAEPFSKQAD